MSSQERREETITPVKVSKVESTSQKPSGNYTVVCGSSTENTPQASPQLKMTKSMSLSSLTNSQNSASGVVDKDDILSLTQQVKLFSDGLAHLKSVFTETTGPAGDLCVMAHSRLGEVLAILKNILHKYPPLQSPELFSASAVLISKIKSFNYGESINTVAEHNFCDAIDQLALSFSSSVSEYLMGDLGNVSQEMDKVDKTKSYGDLAKMEKNRTLESAQQKSQEAMSPEEIDSILLRLQAGVDLAMQRAKAWSKYMKEITSYIERKTQLEADYSKNLLRLAHTMLPVLSEEEHLPLQSVFCKVLSQDMEYASTCQATQALIQASKFVEPLTARRTEHDKMRKNVKELWVKELKKMQEAVNNLRKSQAMYVTRKQEYEKAKEQSSKVESDMLGQSSSSALSKVDKRRKVEEDAMHKAAEAETTYKACVAEANSKQKELSKTKGDLLSRIREQILLCDQVIKSVTVEYFHLLQTITSPLPVQYQELCEASKQYQPGSQYGEFVRSVSMSPTNPPMSTDSFTFEPFISPRESHMRKTSSQSTSSTDIHSQEGSPILGRQDRYRVKAWGQAVVSESDSGSSRSVDSSPSTSPHQAGRRGLVKTGSLGDLEEVDGEGSLLGLPSSDMDFASILKRQHRRRNTTFGVDFQEQVEKSRSAVPPIVTKCLTEIEKRGIAITGIYRMSGVKSKVEGLCARFEKDPESVNLDDEHPNVISNVLKLYLRQLPEPLLSFKLYSSFIQVAKDNMANLLPLEDTVSKLGDLTSKLPYSNFKTCAMLIHHLHRIASFSDTNQMTASNLGIVFGPTLLRPLEGTGSLASLVDTPHQTRTVELLISNVQEIFGPQTEYELIPGETPIEQLSVNGQCKKDNDLDVGSKENSKKSRSPVESGNVELLNIGDKNSPHKNSDRDYVLPGSAEKKSTSPPAVSDGEDCAETPSDDEFPDIILPDGSYSSQHANQNTSVTTTCKGVEQIASRLPLRSFPIKEEIQKVKITPVIMKPIPPQQLCLNLETAKMLIPSINVVESSPVTESQPQMCYPLKSADKSKTKSSALQNLKSIGPSLQSFVIATAKGLKANFPSSAKSDKSDTVKDKKSKTSPPLQRQSSSESLSLSIKNVLQKSPKLPRQASLSDIKEKSNPITQKPLIQVEDHTIEPHKTKDIVQSKLPEQSSGESDGIPRSPAPVKEVNYNKPPSPEHLLGKSEQREPSRSPVFNRKTVSYPMVSDTEFPVQRMTPPITRHTKVSFSLPEDSDSSSVSSGISSLTSPMSSPIIARPTLCRQKSVESDTAVEADFPSDPPLQNDRPHIEEKDQMKLDNESDLKTLDKNNQLKTDSLYSAGDSVKTDTFSSTKTVSNFAKDRMTSSMELEEKTAHKPKIIGKVNEEKDQKIKKAFSSDSLLCADRKSESSKSLTEPFKSTIRSSSLLMSRLSPVLPRSPVLLKRPPTSPPSENAILAGNLPTTKPLSASPDSCDSLTDLKKPAIQQKPDSSDSLGDLKKPTIQQRPSFKPLSQSVPNLMESVPNSSYENLKHSSQSLIDSDIHVKDLKSSGNSLTELPVVRTSDMAEAARKGSSFSSDNLIELNKRSLQIGRPKDVPSGISTNPAITRSKMGPKSHLKCSKSATSVDSSRSPKGPSGIVMGKAAILPNRTMVTKSAAAVGTRKSLSNNGSSGKKMGESPGTSDEKKTSRVSTSKKPSSATLATSQSHNYSCATCGRRRSASKLATDNENLSEVKKVGSLEGDRRSSVDGGRKVSTSANRGVKTVEDTAKKIPVPGQELRTKPPPKPQKDRTPRFV